ncbi:MAG: tRNA (guanine-N1)-methyltransferase [Tenacibaculum sp.]|nr:tRNA (guanine-N1)-methyltransferase [Tenacibaculum sp.]
MKLLNIVFVIVISISAYGQSSLSKNQLDSLPNTIENQFLKTYKKSNNWQDYKIIKKNIFIKLQKNILDSVSSFKKEALLKQKKINEQNSFIKSLEEKIVKLEEDLNISLKNKDGINILGTQLNKVTYNIIMWTIVLLLFVALLFFIFKFKKSNSTTKGAIKNLNSIEEELEQVRKKALEKEQKLRRQLHDEINKNKGN